MASPTDSAEPRLNRRFGLLQATALNMSNMVGIGPFITIPLLMAAVNGGGPQAMLGWLVALVVAACDGMVWSELGAAMPGSGGSYVYLREGFGREKWGRFMAFMFIWQFIFSGPLEIASGYIGFVQYLSYLLPGLTSVESKLVVICIGSLNVFLLYRQIHSIGKITVSLWCGTVLTCSLVIASGLAHFDPKVAFDFPPGAWEFSLGFLIGLGTAARIGVYDYLGYYDICYIGGEVRDPGKVIPRSIGLSIFAVAGIYILMNLVIIGVVPWREFVPPEGKPAANYIVSVFMERIYGPKAASLFTLLILWTAFASCFALLLGYSRIPFAAAADGCFFKKFSELHPVGNFPHWSLLVIGGLAIGCSFLSLGTVIDAMFITRILVQFIGQILGVILLRRTRPDLVRPYRIWLYPLPCLLALAGWIFIFPAHDTFILTAGFGSLAAGVAAFLVWSKHTMKWPFHEKA